ncbi:MAG: acyltransferase [Desulfobulbus sp.]|jgi:peptidoglycan/LPS O-acetylase OafA/YrhL|uniref:acyltransferase family protein n=1 Tax=Desulfobulbus sp. TaxID=895 RepID=UPI002840889F|nr:acyltransferase [Desulfobulbus sp.]MDR2550647.1 acyltransferase [Desulfobulbus sp.]
MRLADYTRGRDNNFNLIRIAAALAVLVSHSFPLALGSKAVEPLGNLVGMSLGGVAVDIFFFTSGFLVTASLLTRQNVKQFAWARILRIYPALIVVVLLSVFGVGLFFTTQPATAYLADAKIYKYLLKSSTLIAGVNHLLPGVFENNPFKDAVNGSLWTMPYEVKMYIILACVWSIARLIPANKVKVFKIVLVLSAAVSGILLLLVHFKVVNTGGYFLKFFYMFFSGASFYILRDKIALSHALFFLFFLLLLVGALFNKHLFFVSYALVLGYCILYLAYIPSGTIRKYNELGDFSYGIYVYAFPVQQSIAALIPGVSAPAMMLYSSTVTLTLAVLSWLFVEKKALHLKEGWLNDRTSFAFPLCMPRSKN